ncbi:zinc finger protein 260-like [Teleopsis dalmanni]|uniref:zinc finger protein 260-like n=1 Tax=Teleopsis dalmanni TaxID=139649 RepID=UPI0018CD4A44|nr:zinc finger protein 260-like [Teleopsis dalmanni]
MSENTLFNIISYDGDEIEEVYERQTLPSNVELSENVMYEVKYFEDNDDSIYLEYSVEEMIDEDIYDSQMNNQQLSVNEQELEQQWNVVHDEITNDDNNNDNFEYEIIEYVETEAPDEDIKPIKTKIKEIKEESECEFLPNDNYKCLDCKRTFNDASGKAQHVCEKFKKAIDNKIKKLVEFYCPNCGKKFSSLPSYHEHTPVCENKFECVHCNRIFKTLKGLVIHTRVHTEKTNSASSSGNLETEITCNVCNTTFCSEKNLKLHMKVHETRPKKTIEQALSSVTKNEYTDMNLFHCEICNKSFDQKLLAVHKNMHLNVKSFTCNICNRRFDTELNYNLHQKMHASKAKERPIQKGSKHLKPGRIFACQYCDRVFPRPHEKVMHERIHTGEKPYECEVCGKTFRVGYSLTLHLRTHTNIRPFVCEICKKRYKSQATYSHHINTHNTECKYKCDKCGKGYRTSVQLCMHKHTHNKPVNCTVCNRPFATLYAVKLHMKTHEQGTKLNENLKHSCKICGAAYARAFALTYHMTDQHNIEPRIANQMIDKANTVEINIDEALSDNSNEQFIESDGDEETKTATRQLTACLEEYNDNIDEDMPNEINGEHFRTEEIITDWLTN